MIQWNPILCRYVSHPYLAGLKPDSPQVIEATYPTEWDEMDLKALKVAAKSWYLDFIAGQSIQIKASGLTVHFPRKGIKKAINQFGGMVDHRILKVVPVLPQMLESAKFLNADTTKAGYVAMLNYKIPVSVEGKVSMFKVCIGIHPSGKFYYTHLLVMRK